MDANKVIYHRSRSPTVQVRPSTIDSYSLKKRSNSTSNSPMSRANSLTLNQPAENENFKVYVRIRPLNSREQNPNANKKKQIIVRKQDNMVIVLDPILTESKREKLYVFDDVFDERVNTASVYDKSIHPILDTLFNGFNATVFAYGMTGAGKTHTMFGEFNNPGMIILTIKEIFMRITGDRNHQYSVKISYLEIYNEHVRDLLIDNSENLMIVEDVIKGVSVSGLTETDIFGEGDVIEIINKGNSRRTMAPTGANLFSSRSHAIIQVAIEKKPLLKDIKHDVICSKLSLIDLAGSERAAATENRGIRMVEGANINRSLLALGNCINILSDPNKKGTYVPFRDSKLTRLLKESLGGNTIAIMIACISPSFISYEETINTLKYANRAKNIKKKVEKNIKEVDSHISEYKEIIENMKVEINMLQKELRGNKNTFNNKGSESKKCGVQDHEFVLELGQKFFDNLHQNYEITLSIKELRDLEGQNEDTMKKYLLELSDPELDIEERERINKEIKTLKVLMINNDRLKNEMDICLEKNLEEKNLIQEHLLKINSVEMSCERVESEEINKKLKAAEQENWESKRQINEITIEKEVLGRKIYELENEKKKMEEVIAQKEQVIDHFKEIINVLSKRLHEAEKNANPTHKKNLSVLSEDEIKTKTPSQFTVQNIKAPGSLLIKDLSTDKFPENAVEVSIVEDCLSDLHLSSIPTIDNFQIEESRKLDNTFSKGRNQIYSDLLSKHQKNLRQLTADQENKDQRGAFDNDPSPNSREYISNIQEKIPLFIENKSDFSSFIKEKESEATKDVRYFRKQPKVEHEGINLPDQLVDINQGNPKYYTQISKADRESKNCAQQTQNYPVNTVVPQRGNVHSTKPLGNGGNRQSSCAVFQSKGASEQNKGYPNIQKERIKRGESLYPEEDQYTKEGLSVEASLHLLNLDEIRGKLRNFKKHMNNLRRDVTEGKKDHDEILSCIKQLLEDYELNKYSLPDGDMDVINSLKSFASGYGVKTPTMNGVKNLEDRRTCSVTVAKRKKEGREIYHNENQEPESNEKKQNAQKGKGGAIGNVKKMNQQQQVANIIANYGDSNSYSQQARKRSSKSKLPDKRCPKETDPKTTNHKTQMERKKSIIPDKNKSQNVVNDNILNFAEAIADYDCKVKPSDQVHTVIQRQKMQMKEEMEKMQKQNHLRNYTQNILGSIYNGADKDGSIERKQGDENIKKEYNPNEVFLSLKDF